MAQIAGELFIDRTAIFASPLFDHLIAPRRFQFKRLADVRFGLFVRGRYRKTRTSPPLAGRGMRKKPRADCPRFSFQRDRKF